jgi:hypothetical protein
MFSQPTVFVVGAGASAEYRLPTGAQMNTSIANALDFTGSTAVGHGDRSMFDMLGNKFGQHSATYHPAATELATTIGEFDSIDEALRWFADRPEIVLLGKAEIVRQILLAEGRSTLFNADDRSLVLAQKYDDTWLPHFLSMVIGSQTRTQAAATAFQNVTIINFNYDRTIEHFLYSRLQTNLGLADTEAIAAIASLKIIRPYGSIGPLPWQGGNTIPFGDAITNDHERLFALAQNVRTFTEQNVPQELHQGIRSAIEAARLVVFLGFGFHQQNMTLLQASGQQWRRVLGTDLGIDLENRDTLKRYIAATVGSEVNRVHLLDRYCQKLLISMKPSLMATL